MTGSDTTSATGQKSALQVILLGGLIAGVLDLTAACVVNGFRGIGPVRVFHSVASGLLGAESYKGGFKTAALGVALHFLIATGATTVYYLASRILPFLTRWPVITGPLYGIAVFFFMNLVVLPLSAIPFKVSFRPALLISGLIVHMLCIGLSIALVVRRFGSSH
ncbi:MAG: hypothetical protein ABJB97_06325 [Acidobacteriota bacterium]